MFPLDYSGQRDLTALTLVSMKVGVQECMLPRMQRREEKGFQEEEEELSARKGMVLHGHWG